MISFETLLQFYVHGIIRRHQGRMDSSEFSDLEKGFKEGVETLEWQLSGRDTVVFNVLMETANKFLADGNVEIALAFYREASYLFPHVAACYRGVTSCHLNLKFFDQAKKACRKAITHSDPDDFSHFLEIIDQFVMKERLQEAHDLYISLIDKFPHRYDILDKVEELKESLQKAEEDKAKTEYKTERNASKDSNGIKKKTGKNVGQSTAKVVKKSKKQLRREQMLRQKEIEKEIVKAAKEQEVELKKQEELKARKRKEKEEKEEKLRKEAEEEASIRKKMEEHKKKLMKQKNDEVKKKQTNEHVGKKSPSRSKVMDTQTMQSKNKVSLNDMSNAFDQILESGSRVRCVCPTCNTPRAFSYSRRFCHLCNSEFVIWAKKINTTNWTQQRKPPKGVVGRYQLCKHFQIGQKCAKVPCTFAHSQDEMDIWKLYPVTSTASEDSEEHKASYPSIRKRSRSCMTLNGDESGNGRLSRTDSLSSLTSLQSFPNAFGVTVENQEKPQKVISQKDLNIENRSENKEKTKASSNSTKTGSQVFDNISSVMEQEKLRCTYCNVRFLSLPQLKCHYSETQHKVNVLRRVRQLNTKFTMKLRFPYPKKLRVPPDGVYMGRYKLCHRFEKGYCYLHKQCTFAHGKEERDYWIELYQRQVEYLTQLEKKQLVTESFGEKVRRRMQHEDFVLKRSLPGVSVNCNSPLQKQLYDPGDHEWIIEVRIQTKYGLLLSEVSFLLETHLDKFEFRRSGPEEDHSLNKQSIRFFEDDFVDDSFKQESAVQFKVKFSSDVFGDFKQKIVFDFGRDMVLVRALSVSISSRDICDSKEKSISRTIHFRILEWSLGEMELVECKDLIPPGSDCVSGEQYCIPNHLPNRSEVEELTRESYCNLWHDILFIEEKHIQAEVRRYDIENGTMKIVNYFRSTSEMVFAPQGELFGEIYLSDYLVLDEVAGHLINRSVMSVIVRPRMTRSQSKKVYECSIKLKASQSVIIKLNEALLKDYVFQNDQEIYIDVKFRYNRVPMCEMHQAIDMCKQKTEVLLPNLKNVSYKFKKSIPDWFMGDKKPNTNQHEAIAMILDPNPTPPILVIGPFGTGKTFTLNLACVKILSQSRLNKVLICTHSNSAADVHLEHLNAKIENNPLLNNLRPLRVLNLFRKINTVPQVLRKYCLIEESTNIIKKPLWEEICDHNVIITTLASARMLWKFYLDGKLCFTHILIDEAAQALEPECLTPLAMADEKTKIVLAGDHKQMGPPVYSKCLWAEDFGPKRSLLERLFTYYKQYSNPTLDQLGSSLDRNSSLNQTPYVVMLTENYRCHAKILEFPSDCFYGGKLIAKGDQSTHDLVPVLSFYTAQGIDNRDEGSLAYYNDAEVAEVVKRVEELIQLWPKEWSKSIGVLTPYHDQVKRIRDSLRKKDLRYVDVETVENVQGKEFKALFISTVRTMWTCSQIEGRNEDLDPSELDFGFLSDPRFLNTAVTRAQSLLAVIGDPMSLCRVGACRNLWKDYLRRCDDNKGLYGCTLKSVKDFCLHSQQLDPSAHEFVPVTNKQDKKDETPTDTFSKGNSKVSSEENGYGIENGSASNTELGNDSVSIKCGPPSTFTNSNIETSPLPAVNGQDHERGEEMYVDGKSDLAVSNQNNSIESAASENENDTKTDQSATDNFFRRHDVDNFDKIIEELIKACEETTKRDEDPLKKAGNEHFPSLNDVSQVAVTPHSRKTRIKRAFFAGVKDGKIELGFHVKKSEALFRLTGGKSTSKEKGDRESYHDTETFSQESLLELLKGNSNLFIKCSFRKDPRSRQQRCYGEQPTPDSPDIHIPGRVRGVQEDDVIVVELQPIARARDEKQQDQVITFGCIKGILRRLIEPKECQFVCTVDRRNPSVMIPINKNLPKLVNLTKTDEDIIPIYTFQDEQFCRAKKLSRKHYEEALAGERVIVVKYLKWRSDCPYPLGLAIHHIPHGKDFKTGMEILYKEHNVRRKFSPELRPHVAKDFGENWEIPLSEKGRPVYRNNVFTIDPPESLDLDDAISIQALSNGNFDLHIHIADVSYFVQPNTPLDEEANLRATSYYPPKPHETVPMLPRELSEDCCSLLEGRDRLAVTVSVEVKADGTIVGDTRIARSIVCSSSRLTYLQAQGIIDESSQTDSVMNGETRQIPVEEAIVIIHRIAQERRKVRLGFEKSLYERKRDDCDEDIDNEREAHQMIEEIMVMANHLVAKYLLIKFPKSTPLRVQPPPKTRRVVEWRQRFQKFINFSLGLECLKDTESKHEETIELKVPVKTWSKIMDQARENSNFKELVKLVCDLDSFPQLAAANVRQQLLQQRGQYRCSGETFEGLRYPWPQNERGPPIRRQIASANHVSTDINSADNENFPGDSNDHATNCDTQTTDDIPSSSTTSSDELSSFSTALDDRADEANSENTDGASSVNESVQCSPTVSKQQNLKKILYGHSSLCLDAYCHFTSPIRRYIDIIVHRLLVASIEENRASILDPDYITTLCDRCTFFARNCHRFDKNAKKLQLAVQLQNSLRFFSAFLEEVAPDALKLFFGTGKFELLRGESVRIARLGPDKDPEKVDNGIELQWTFRFLRLDKEGRAQPRLDISDDEISQDQTEDKERSDDDFDYTVSGEHWKEVLDAVKNQNEDQLRSRLHEVDGDIKKQDKPESPVKVSLVKRSKDNSDKLFKVTRSFKPYDRVKVQISSRMNRGVLSPAIQLFKLTNTIHACIEHRGFPTTCFAKTSYKRPANTDVSNVTEYVQLWKPVLMMEIATSAVRDDDVIMLSNLGVSLTRDTKGLVTIEFSLSHAYCKKHFSDPLDLNLMCVRVKDPGGSGKDTGYWVGHFQISEELRMKEDARKLLEEVDGNASTQTGKDAQPVEVFEIQETKKTEKSASSEDDDDAKPKTNEDEIYKPILGVLIHSSTPVPESIITQRFFYITVELIILSIPDRRRLGALVGSAVASGLVQDICIGKDLDRDTDEEEVPRNLSLCNVHHTLNDLFEPLNKYQQHAVQEALTKSFTLIQGPPGTGKTVTGVHIAYWFAQLNKKRTRSMVFYCGPSNKSVDVVARYLMNIPHLKILRMYGQEIERKVFPVPDKITLFRSKRVAVQLKADEDLKDVSLHHVIRSAECPFAKELRQYDEKFKKYIECDSEASPKEIEEFNQIKSKAEKWAITQTGVNVILVTCTTAYSPRTLGRCEGFVCQCIIDECGMCIEAETLCAMLGSNAKQIVLIGDHKQLQPIIQCDKAKDLGLGISMFERFSERAQMLKIQYRMHEELCQFPSEFFYGGQLETADQVRNRIPDNVTWPNGERYPFVFHHVEGIEESLIVTTDKGNENSKKNQKEIAKVINLARKLSNEGIKGENIVILSPYRAQCFEINGQLKQHGLSNISVMSVVAAQGSEKDYVILSLVRSLPQREIEKNPSRTWLNEHLGFITDEHQINVALTRAKRGLCIVGNKNLIGVSSMWKALLEHYENKHCLKMGAE